MAGDRFNWRLPLYAMLGAFVLFVPVALCEPFISFLVYALVILIISLVFGALLLMDAIARKTWRCLSTLSILAMFWATSAILVGNYLAVRTAARWLVWSHDYKVKVLAEPAPPNGELKHTEWDGWGFAGAGDTTVFVVFDPTDSLSAAAASHQSGKFSGIPCDVFRVRRLESHWYTAQFYTDEYWGQCN